MIYTRSLLLKNLPHFVIAYIVRRTFTSTPSIHHSTHTSDFNIPSRVKFAVPCRQPRRKDTYIDFCNTSGAKIVFRHSWNITRYGEMLGTHTGTFTVRSQSRHCFDTDFPRGIIFGDSRWCQHDAFFQRDTHTYESIMTIWRRHVRGQWRGDFPLSTATAPKEKTPHFSVVNSDSFRYKYDQRSVASKR